MYEKSRVAFSRKEIFGNKFKPNINACFCTVSKMLFGDMINTDGTIDIDKSVNLSKEELWSYIYYLYFYNNTNVKVFKSMKNEDNGKASAAHFYDTVISMVADAEDDETKPAKPFDTTTLIIFINNVLEEFGKELINPIFDYLGIILKKNIISRISGISIKTGNESSNSGKIKIVTDEKDVANANVKFSLSVDGNVEKLGNSKGPQKNSEKVPEKSP